MRVGCSRLWLGWELVDRVVVAWLPVWGDRVDDDILFWDTYGFVAFGLWVEKAEFNGPELEVATFGRDEHDVFCEATFEGRVLGNLLIDIRLNRSEACSYISWIKRKSLGPIASAAQFECPCDRLAYLDDFWNDSRLESELAYRAGERWRFACRKGLNLQFQRFRSDVVIVHNRIVENKPSSTSYNHGYGLVYFRQLDRPIACGHGW